MIDDKPCPRCYSLDRTTSDTETCWSCGLVKRECHWYLSDGREFDYDLEMETRRYGWSILRDRQGKPSAPPAADGSSEPGQ